MIQNSYQHVLIILSIIVQKYKPQEKGKAKAKDLVREFKDTCQSKILRKRFGPEDFENSNN